MLVGIFGTMWPTPPCDAGVPYLVSAPVLAVDRSRHFCTLARIEAHLDVATIDTRRRELPYWVLVVATFALGTALARFERQQLGLGYLASALQFTAMIVPPALLFWRSKRVAAFWCAMC